MYLNTINSRREFLGKGLAAVGAAVAVAVGGFDGPSEAAARRPIGGFVSPTLGHHLVYEGIADPKQPGHMSAIAANVRGVVHELGTATGGLGVTTLAGHRTSWSRPFRNIHRLPVGEVVRFDNYVDNDQTSYRVVEIKFPLDPVAAYQEVCGNTVAYGSDTRLNLYACSRRNGQPTSTVYRIAAFCVAV